MKTTLIFNKRRVMYLSFFFLFACALVFAGLKGASCWNKKSDFDRRVYKMVGVLYSFWDIPAVFEEKDKPIIDNYVAYNKRDKPLGSWRMAFLYYDYMIDNSGSPRPGEREGEWDEGGKFFGVYYQPFKRWDEEPNYSFHCEEVCWNDNPRSPHYNDTSVMALVGPGTAFETIQDIQVPTLFEAKLQECRAGAAILFIEAVNSGVHWGEPGDFDVETVTKEQLFPGDTEGILVAFADWSIWYIERTVPMETLKHFMTIESSKEHDREKELSPYGKWIPRDS